MAQNELQIVTFEQAKRLKAAGFDWEVNKIYDIHHSFRYDKAKLLFDYPTGYNNNSDRNDYSDVFSAPTVALALKWFRDVKGYIHGVWNYVDYFKIGIYHDDNGWKIWGEWLTYEEAESALLDALLTELEGEQCSAE